MSEKRKLVGNSLSMLISRLVQSITTFVLTAAIARILGANQLGQYLLAFSYYFIFVNIASQGLKTLFTRELSREPLETPTYLVNGTVLQFLLSVIGYVALVVVVFVLPYSPETSKVCYIMGLAIIPFSLSNITEALFQAQEKMHLIAVSTVPVYILRLVAMIWEMTRGYGVSYLAGTLVISEFLVLVFEWILLAPSVKPKWLIKKDFISQTVRNAFTFFVIEGTSVASSRMEILILSLLNSEFQVGLYGGITQLMQPFLIVANSIVLAAFPSMSRAAEPGQRKQRQITENMIEMLLVIALPLMIGFLFIGDGVLKFIYSSSDFSEATVALKVTSVTLIILPFTRTLSYLLVANGFERINMRELIVTTILGSLLGVILVSQYQLIGAAVMRVIVSLIAFSQYIYAVYRRLFSLNLWQVTRRPLLISVLMMLVFALLQKTTFNFVTVIITATFAYTLIVTILGIYIFGGPHLVWVKIRGKE
jgi:O-antigen/teichoic acid export membrane protein